MGWEVRLSNAYASFKTPLQRSPLPGNPPPVDLPGLTFDLGNECTSGCESLHRVQEWVFGDDLAHYTKSFTQALMGEWPAGLKEVCWAELALDEKEEAGPSLSRWGN